MTILFFPNGTVQCVGQCDDNVLDSVHSILESVLQQHLPKWQVRTMTVLCELKHTFDFRHLTSSSKVTYEVELFPAAQLTLWKTYHVHVFHNGKMIITGLKDLSCLPQIVEDVEQHFFRDMNIECK